MKDLRYLENVTTLVLDEGVCTGCGACARNCPVAAIRVTPGVGCASYIIQTWVKGKEAAACGGIDCC